MMYNLVITITFFGFAVFKTIRLANSLKTTEGVVKVFVDGEWGVICDDNLLTRTLAHAFADVVCRQLGLSKTNINITDEEYQQNRNSYFKAFKSGYDRYNLGRKYEGTYVKWFYDDLRCKGTEETLRDCYYSREWDQSCLSGGNVAAVKCNNGKLKRVIDWIVLNCVKRIL